MKAIETHYKGYRFRSRLEARWAVFFDALSAEWRYEPEGYNLGDGIAYLPDFWFPAQQCFIEIKPDIPTDEERQKAALLAEQSGHWVDVVCGEPLRYRIYGFRGSYGNFPTDRGGRHCFALCDDCGALTIASITDFYDGSEMSALMGKPYYFSHCYKCDGHAWGGNDEYREKHTRLFQGLFKAQQARFEYGETP